MEKQRIVSLEKKFIMQSYKRAPVVIERGDGVYVWDSDGKKYLDLCGALATASIGHANKEVANAVCGQSKKLVNATNLYYTEPQARLAEKLARISGLGKCFFSNSGSEAVEIAIKLARQHTGKKGIICTANAFHGRTFAALTATANKKYRDFCKPLVPGFRRIPFNNAKALEKAIDGNTAAFIVEPIQGESGINVPGKGYLKEIRKICDEKGILLILDEVQSGCGRTGEFFAYQHEGIRPDIVAVAKGIAGGFPLGVTIAKEGVEFQKGQQGSTFGGNCISCAAANATIDYIMEKNLMQNAMEAGNYFMQKLEMLKNRHRKIKEVRGMGLMVGVELKGSADEVAKICMGKGLLVNVIDGRILRFLPPLIISRKEVDIALKILENAFKEAAI